MKYYFSLVICILFYSCISNNETTDFNQTQNLGEAIYQSKCATCHQANGEGIPGIFPPLADSDFLKNNLKTSIKAVKNGLSDKITVNNENYNSTMPAQNLSDQEVVDVMNFILNSWGNNYGNISLKDVE